MDDLHKRRPPNTSFKQQRLKAWQPIMTAKTVLPTFFIVGVLFAPLGGLLVWKNNQVTEMSFDYTACNTATQPVAVPESSFSHSSSVAEFPKPTYMINPNVTRNITSVLPGSAAVVSYTVHQCTITLTIPVDLKPPVMMYYKLTNFYQNHRKYAKSLDYKQLQGDASSLTDLKARKGCANLDTDLIYPCGLIANSQFNDTISNLVTADGGGFNFQSTGIASAADHGKYTRYGYPDLTQILPPANWRSRYPNGTYTPDFPPPDISQDEHFQVWMRTAGWPTFLKTYGRNDVDTLVAGQYTMTIDMNFPIDTYGGKKYIVFSTVTGLGGRNSFLGIGYIVLAVLCAGLGVIFTAFHIARPRIIGDHSKISFGGEATSHTRSSNRADDAGGNRIRSRYEDD
ncbi:hypothetical protein BGX26_002051 [Mortierella sp. AD094]|nr:hypothetical protein BGX26_002051 [Mortierella sp. AD094]